MINRNILLFSGGNNSPLSVSGRLNRQNNKNMSVNIIDLINL